MKKINKRKVNVSNFYGMGGPSREGRTKDFCDIVFGGLRDGRPTLHLGELFLIDEDKLTLREGELGVDGPLEEDPRLLGVWNRERVSIVTKKEAKKSRKLPKGSQKITGSEQQISEVVNRNLHETRPEAPHFPRLQGPHPGELESKGHIFGKHATEPSQEGGGGDTTKLQLQKR